MQLVLLVLILPSFVLIGVSGYTNYVSGDQELVKVAGSAITQQEFDQATAGLKTMFGTVFVIVFSAASCTVLIVMDWAPQLLPFLQGRTQPHIYAAAVLFGIFCAAMSPAATLAILQETRAKGRITSLVLGITQGNEWGWTSARVLGIFALSAALLAGFAVLMQAEYAIGLAILCACLLAVELGRVGTGRNDAGVGSAVIVGVEQTIVGLGRLRRGQTVP